MVTASVAPDDTAPVPAPPSGLRSPEEGGSKSQRNRSMKTPEQKEALEAAFSAEQYPKVAGRTALGLQLGLTEPQVQQWFVSRRSKDRKMQAAVQPSPLSGQPPAGTPLIRAGRLCGRLWTVTESVCAQGLLLAARFHALILWNSFGWCSYLNCLVRLPKAMLFCGAGGPSSSLGTTAVASPSSAPPPTATSNGASHPHTMAPPPFHSPQNATAAVSNGAPGALRQPTDHGPAGSGTAAASSVHSNALTSLSALRTPPANSFGAQELAELLAMAKASLPEPYREDGPLLAIEYDDPPSGSSHPKK